MEGRLDFLKRNKVLPPLQKGRLDFSKSPRSIPGVEGSLGNLKPSKVQGGLRICEMRTVKKNNAFKKRACTQPTAWRSGAFTEVPPAHSVHARTCTPLAPGNVHHSAPRNARIVRHACSSALAPHPLAPPNRHMSRCTMTSMPATKLATADKMDLSMVTEIDDRRFKQLLSASEAVPRHVVEASQQGRPQGGGR